MISDLESVVPHLMEWGLVGVAEILAGKLKISNISRRNCNFRVECGRAPGFLIKQADPNARNSRETLRSEWAFYAFCQEHPRLSDWVRWMPRGLDFRAADEVLMIELLAQARTWGEELHDQDLLEIRPDVSSSLGEALGTLHRLLRDPSLSRVRHLKGLPSAPPPSLDLHRPRVHALRRLSPARSQWLRAVQDNDDLCRGLEGLRTTWCPDTLLHGDLRADNVLVMPPTTSTAIRLVDWELVRWGEAAMDLGTTLHNYVLAWLLGMPLDAGLETSSRIAAARRPLTAFHPAIHLFWQTYLVSAEIPPRDQGTLLRRVMLFAAARLLLSSWEHGRQKEKLSVLDVLQMQLAANLFSDPVEAGRQLFGLTAAS